MILTGLLNKEKASPADAGLPAFLFPSLRLASGHRPENKKAGYFVPGFFFVAEGFEISNLELVKGLKEVIDFVNNTDLLIDNQLQADFKITVG